MKYLAVPVALALSLLVACDQRPSSSAPATPADNTGKNVRDRDGDTKTPTDQMENESDVRVTAAVRKAIVDDDTMSVNAENCKIITAGGVVTLRGPVNSQAEKDAVGAKAAAVAGVTRVDNQLEVKAP